jgi:hypothetical protein
MIKLLMFALIAGFVVLGSGFVFAQLQPVEGDVDDSITFVILPQPLNFGSIPFGSSVNFAGPDITVNTDGSDTESNSVWVDASVDTNGDSTFFEDLLMVKKSTEESFGLLNSMSVMEINEGSILTLNTMISGNTAFFNSGPKTGVITYTVMATPPGP